MAKLSFSGGIRPASGKKLTIGNPITDIYPEKGEKLYYPLQQHIGNPAIPVVEAGEYVRAGQLIAAQDGSPSSNIHSAVSGYVREITQTVLADGTTAPCIVIENDGMYLEILYPAESRLDLLSRQMIMDSIEKAGVVGLGGSGMPTHFKWYSAMNSRIDTVIANGTECEPYMTSNARRIIENPEKVLEGLQIMLKIFPQAKGFIAISDDQPEGIRILQDMTKDNGRIFVKCLKSRYPVGSERQLIYAITGRSFNAGMLPYEVGCLADNIETLCTVRQAVIAHEPMITRILTVTGDALANPGNYRVRLGMTYGSVLEKCGGLKNQANLQDLTCIDGGSMRGRRLTHLQGPVLKTSCGMIFSDARDMDSENESACIRCGRCLDVCPNRLEPVLLYNNLLAGNKKAFIRHYGMECCGCGCCSYVCPAKIPLSSQIFRNRDRLLDYPDLVGNYARRFPKR